jgi:hypothetical protein
MKDSSLNETDSFTYESVGHSSPAAVKRNWQTPKLTEMDYSETRFGIGPGPDGSENS